MSFWKKPEQTALQKAHAAALVQLSNVDEGTKEYKEILKNVTRLSELVAQEKGCEDKVSKDVIVKVAGSAILTLIIVGYESRNVITTKAPTLINFLPLNKSN